MLGTSDWRKVAPELRAVVRESWLRSLGFLSAKQPTSRDVLPDEELDERLRVHRLGTVIPVFDRLLASPAEGTGLLVAIGDETGRLLWVQGDAPVRRRAEAMAFQPGADWSERAVGTSAPGTALVTGVGVQVSGAEHFNPIAHQWSCTAVPIHDPLTGELLGVVDLTGGDDAVAAHSLALLRAAVAAAESELRWQSFTGDRSREPAMEFAAPPAAGPGKPGYLMTRTDPGPEATPVVGPTSFVGGGVPRLRVGGPVPPAVSGADGTAELSLRHAEILTLLAWHRHGLGSEELAELLVLDPEAAHAGTLRAEMVRLRKAMAGVDAGFVPASRPYRLGQAVMLDAREVADAVATGDLDAALEAYAGPVLARSEAPGIAEIRAEVSGALRQAMLQDATAGQLVRYLGLPETLDDEELLETALQVLGGRSPHRAVVVARLERLRATGR
ncbi:GAF domain-containing protein [Paeniglutamicibacter cryotolerans]